MATGLFLSWRLVFAGDPHLWPLNIIVMLALGWLLTLLSGPEPSSARRLATLEFALFGTLAAFMAVRQYDGMSEIARDLASGKKSAGDVSSALQMSVKNALICMIIVAFSYSMLIPNAWKRAAKVVIALMVVPLLTQGAVFLTQRNAARLAYNAATMAGTSENVLYLVVATSLAIYGTFIVNRLRFEVFEARQINQYRLVDRLGSGGMGEVFRAEHRMLKRPCAIKLIKPDRADDRMALARFEREVQATAKLSHPNTIEIYDFGTAEDGSFFYVMELLPGLSLEAILQRFGPMPAGRVVYLLRQACEALSEAHAAGLVHRDIKPGNLFASYRGGRHDVAKVLDFGLVKGGDEPGSPDLSHEGNVRGTPHFMAPEQAMGDPDLDFRCDLYAIGAVAYALLTGQTPFEGHNAVLVMVAVAREPVVPPSTRNPDVPVDLEAVIMKALAKDRQQRHQSAEELALDLAACACASDWDAKRAAQWWRRSGRIERGVLRQSSGDGLDDPRGAMTPASRRARR